MHPGPFGTCSTRIPVDFERYVGLALVELRARPPMLPCHPAVMEDHVHLLLLPDHDIADVSRILNALKTRTATRIAERQRLEGESVVRIWQRAGGHDRNVTTHRQFLESVDTIEDNPLRKGHDRAAPRLSLVVGGLQSSWPRSLVTAHCPWSAACLGDLKASVRQAARPCHEPPVHGHSKSDRSYAAPRNMTRSASAVEANCLRSRTYEVGGSMIVAFTKSTSHT